MLTAARQTVDFRLYIAISHKFYLDMAIYNLLYSAISGIPTPLMATYEQASRTSIRSRRA